MKEGKAECHLCMITSYEQTSPPRLVWKKNSSHLHLLYLTLLPWEFIYAKLRNFTISKRGWVVNMHKGQSLHWESKTHKLKRSIKARFQRQLSIKRCVFAYSLFTTAELSLRGGARVTFGSQYGSLTLKTSAFESYGANSPLLKREGNWSRNTSRDSLWDRYGDALVSYWPIFPPSKYLSQKSLRKLTRPQFPSRF